MLQLFAIGALLVTALTVAFVGMFFLETVVGTSTTCKNLNEKLQADVVGDPTQTAKLVPCPVRP
jgi:hypothetical protein